MVACNCLDAGPESRAGEQDRVRAGRSDVAPDAQEALGHGVRELAVTGEVRRERVVEVLAGVDEELLVLTAQMLDSAGGPHNVLDVR